MATLRSKYSSRRQALVMHLYRRGLRPARVARHQQATPAACGLVVPLMVVLVTVTPVKATPPTVAVAPIWKSEPPMVTAAPPVVGPLVGEMELTVDAFDGS